MHPLLRRLAFCRLLAGAATLVLVASSAGAALAATTLHLWGDPGEPLTGGASLWYSDATTTFTFSRPAGGLRCVVSSGWTLTFRGPIGHALTPGTYGPVCSAANDNEVRCEIVHGTSWQPNSGSFQVRKLGFAANGSVREAWITWAVQCVASGPWQHGELRVDADTTLWQAIPADAWCFGGDSIAFTTQATQAAGRAISLATSGLPDGARFDDLGGGVGRFRWKHEPVSSALQTTATVIAADDAGGRDTVTTWLHVVPRLGLTLRSEAGEDLLKGQGDSLLAPSTDLRIVEPSGNCGLVTTWSGHGRTFSITMEAPYGRLMAEGAYEGATAACRQASMLPGLGVTVGSTVCGHVVGRFEIRRLSRDASGKISGIWATFEHHCDGELPRLLGDLRYNVDTTLYLGAPADLDVEPGDSVRIAARAVSTCGGVATLDVRDLPDGAVYSGHGTAGGVLCWRAPAANGEWCVTFIAADDRGGRDTVRTRIHSLAPQRLMLQTTGSDCSSLTTTLALTGLENDFASRASDSTTASVRATGVVGGGFDARAPFGFALRKGSYPLVSYEYAGADRIYGYMDYGSGATYSYLERGGLEIRKLTRDASQTRSLWAVWRGGCNAPAGEMIFNADTSLYISAPAFAMVERDRELRFAVAGVSAARASVQLTCTQQPAGSSFLPGVGGSGTFTWSGAAPTGNQVATFVATDAAGKADTLSTVIRVMEPRLMVAQVEGAVSGLSVPPYSRLDATNANFAVFSAGVVDLFVYGNARTWEFRVVAPYGRRVTPGVYEQADRADNWTLPHSPGISVSCSGQTVNARAGAFHVRRIGFDAAGRLSQLWMTFDTPGTPRTSGELRFGDPDTALYLAAPADLFVEPRAAVGFTVRATQVAGRAVRLSARGVPGGASFHDNGDGTGTFGWPSVPAAGTVTPVTVLASDDEGRQDSCVTYLHVVVPAEFSEAWEPTTTHGSAWLESFSTDATRSDFTLVPYLTSGAVVGTRSLAGEWQITLGAPADGRLVPGEYRGATTPDWSDGTTPVLRVCWNNAPCRGEYGSFKVLAATYDSTGRITALHATFRDTCYPGAEQIFGTVRYGDAGAVVPVLAVRLLASGEDGVARLQWAVPAVAAAELQLDRRGPDEADWRTVARLERVGQDRVSYEDADVRAGASYAYRLVCESIVLDEVEVTVRASVAFGIGAVGPNPVSRTLSVQLLGRGSGSVSFHLVDIAGRVVWSDVLPADPGTASRLALRLPGSLSPGVYLLRAAWGGGESRRRIVVLR